MKKLRGASRRPVVERIVNVGSEGDAQSELRQALLAQSGIAGEGAGLAEAAAECACP